jgi:hypothetical protein
MRAHAAAATAAATTTTEVTCVLERSPLVVRSSGSGVVGAERLPRALMSLDDGVLESALANYYFVAR